MIAVMGISVGCILLAAFMLRLALLKIVNWIENLEHRVEALESRHPCNPCRDDNAANCERVK